ncbi:MAG: hypothetical protein Unbinned706contig1001_27 [Prokaryotic dsDNA virus sp.]|nr:MAG: hypothetical protein Unbinned706contig1001_27 [Prokaryotic dsDNA virus sp.]|tara:strand:- start:23441 stop:25345 length:1905 start_codon:yes stop_codon:yes gene_type:complete
MAKKKTTVEFDLKVKGADKVEKSFDGVAESAEGASKKVEKVSNKTGGLKGAFQSAQGGVKGLLGGFNAVIANPIGAVIAAVVAAVKLLSEMFATNEEASDKLGQGFAYIKGLLLPLKEAFFAVFDAIVFAVEKPGEAWDNVVNAFETGFDFLMDNILKPGVAILQNIFLKIKISLIEAGKSVKEFFGMDPDPILEKRLANLNKQIAENNQIIDKAGENIAKTYEAVVEKIVEVVEEADRMGSALAALTKREQDLTRAKREQEVQNAKSLAQLEQLKVIRDDESKSLEERIAANKKIGEIEANRVAQAVSLAQKELKLLKDRGNLVGFGGELLDQITEKEIELAEFRNENAGIRAEQIVNDVNLRKEQFEKEAALVDQQLQLDSVLEENAVKLADAKIAAEERKLAKLQELGLQENQIFRDQQFNLLMAQEEAEKAKLDAKKEADDLLIEQNADAKAQQEQDDKDSAKMKVNIEKELNSQIKNLSSSLVGALNEDSKAAMVIQKAVALGEIAVNTARAISSLVAASSANPANAVTFGAAGAAQFAAGVLQIGANLAQAYTLLKKPAPQLDTDGGGGASGPAPTTEQTSPDLGFEGRSAGTERFGANIPIKAYVTESDITTSQNTASNIQQLSQIG